MFLDMTMLRNPKLIEVACDLHRTGRIEPDTYVVDLDTVHANAAALAKSSRENDVELWFVSKQFGRNPCVIRAVAEHLPLGTAIDHREADALLEVGVHLANLGHLVQVPRRRLSHLLGHRPDFVTVVDEGNLAAVAEAAEGLLRRQPVLLKMAGSPDSVYPGQEGGIELPDLPELLERWSRSSWVSIEGATGFPCMVFDDGLRKPRGTGTLERVLEAGMVFSAHGIEPKLSLPSHTSVSTIPFLADRGAAFAEPGHALTGTTPEHAQDASLAEVPAMVYVSEVAQLGSAPSVFGGGFYARGRARSLLVQTAAGTRQAFLRDAPADSIDYYRRFDWAQDGPAARIGDTAVMAFRTQIFVTRSRVATISGISSGHPVLEGLHDALGRSLK